MQEPLAHSKGSCLQVQLSNNRPALFSGASCDCLIVIGSGSDLEGGHAAEFTGSMQQADNMQQTDNSDEDIESDSEETMEVACLFKVRDIN